MTLLAPFSETGLSLSLRHGWRSLALALAVGLGFGVWMALADRTVFAGVVPPGQHAVLAAGGPLARIALFARGALIDELVLRLIAMTMLCWIAVRVCGRKPGAYWAAILSTAFVAYPLKDLGYFASLDWSGPTLAREVLLHGAASTLWGWLYWRQGWLAALTGHIGAHLALQPLLTFAG